MKKFIVIPVFVVMFALLVVGAAAAQDEYTHPTGAFSVLPFGELVDEVEDGALFASDDAQVMVVFGEVPVEFTEEALPDVLRPLLDGLQDFETYTINSDQMQPLVNGTTIPFDYTTAEGDGQGEAFVTQADGLLYVMILLAADYDAVFDDWAATVDSFTPGAEVIPFAEPSPEVKPVPAKSTPTPAPKASPTPKKPASGSAASSTFEPNVDGFSFYNYGDDIPATNLTPEEVQRMFGDAVCASLAGDTCVLTPPAQQWMEQINSYMSGGHCEGMAVLSTLMYYDQVAPAEFGGKTAFDLAIDGNDPLQREIAYWWTTQATYPGSTVRVSESPSAVVEALQETFAEGKQASEWWAMGFYQPDGSEGHAVTPIGVEDLGGGLYNILIYDNNFPGETRAIEVDTNSETWQYEGSPNPEIESFLYTGDADLQNLELVAISPRLETQQCDFCAGGPVEIFDGEGTGALNSARGQAGSSTVQEEEPEFPIWADALKRWGVLVRGQADDYYQIWLVGKSDLLVVDDWGRAIGYSEGKFVNEIPGASTVNMRIFQQKNPGLDKDKSPVFRVPVGLSFDITVDGTPLEEAGSSDVTMIGPGYYLEVSDIWLEPDEMDTISVYVDKSRHQLTYYTDYSESPDIQMGLDTDTGSYALNVRATELVGADDSFDIGIDFDTNEFIINTSYNTDPSTYQIWVLRIDDSGEYVFGADDVTLDPENTVYIPFAQPIAKNAGLQMDVDYENDGEIDDSFELPDISADVDFYGASAAE
ncbi:MAG: hypothetical protein FOGNACKC_05374 [Anaerolineae bacterium]|nr:hypothetical protein [Anaerolineae bacterium]